MEPPEQPADKTVELGSRESTDPVQSDSKPNLLFQLLPPVRSLFNLVLPSPIGWAYVGAASAGAVFLSRAIAAGLPLTDGKFAPLRRFLASSFPAPTAS